MEIPADSPAEAIGFNFDNATFTHIDARVTFEILLASFDLEVDPALTHLGILVHYLNFGDLPVSGVSEFQAFLRVARQTIPCPAKLAGSSTIFTLIFTESYNNE